MFKDSTFSRTQFPLIWIFEIYFLPPSAPSSVFGVLAFLTYMAKWEYQQCSLAVLQTWWNFEV